MPQYLKTSSLRLLEASQEALNLAFVGLGLPARHELRVEGAQFAAPVGLIGAAAEQALAAILVQVLGEEALMAAPNHFKSAQQVLKEVRTLLRTPVPKASFLTIGIADAAAHREALHQTTEGFILLIAERAAGLHAGFGPSRAVAMVQAEKVLDFYRLLALSSRIRPYLEQLPRPPDARVDQHILVDELARRFREAETTTERSVALRSLFLVLPEVPDEAPEWLEAFDRSAVAPTNNDISLLLETLERAQPVQFQRLSAAGQGLPVAVRPQDPNALPIAPQHMRRSFGSVSDQFFADVANANGRLDEGHLDEPPERFLLDLCVLGPVQLASALTRTTLSGHEVWPFVITALSQQGTERPFWFLVSLVDDLGQLIGQLRRAFAVARGPLRARQVGAIEALEALKAGQPLAPENSLANFAKEAYATAEAAKLALSGALERSSGTNKAVPAEAELELRRVAQGEVPAGQAFGLVQALAGLEARRYWARLLATASTDTEDRSMLVSVLLNRELAAAQTAARKALKLIDAIAYGPQIELEEVVPGAS